MPRGTPTELARLRGTLYQARQKRLGTATGAIGPAPEYLSKTARRIWRQTAESAPEPLLRQMDRTIFSAYCSIAGLIEEQQVRLASLPEKNSPAGRGCLKVIASQTSQLLRVAKALGLTPEMRSRMDLPVPNDKPASDWDVDTIAS